MNIDKRNVHLFYGFVPLLVYYGVTMIVIHLGDMFRWENDILNFVNEVLNLVVLYVFFYRVYNMRGGSRKIPPLFGGGESCKTSQKIVPKRMYLWIAILGFFGSIAFNNWFSIMGLFQKITTYREVSESIYYGSLWMIFLRTAILAPLLEEVLARGLLYRCFSSVAGRVPGMICSALVFALMHGNLLQGMYAFVLGILFAYVYDMSGRNLFAPILAHSTANVLSILGTCVPAVTLWLGEYFYIMTGVATVLVLVSIVMIYDLNKKAVKVSQTA